MAGKKVVIVISGEPGAGSTTIAKEVAKRLNLDFFSPGLLLKGLSGKKEESKAALATLKTEKGSSKEYHNELDRRQVEAARKGNVVITGKLGIHFTKEFADLCVWLDVSPEVRARRTAGRDGITEEEALKSISEREEIDRKAFLRIYGFDYKGQKDEADLALDTSRLTINQAVDTVLSAFRQKNRS